MTDLPGATHEHAGRAAQAAVRPLLGWEGASEQQRAVVVDLTGLAGFGRMANRRSENKYSMRPLIIMRPGK